MIYKVIYEDENGRTCAMRCEAECEEEALDLFEYTVAQEEFVEIINVVEVE